MGISHSEAKQPLRISHFGRPVSHTLIRRHTAFLGHSQYDILLLVYDLEMAAHAYQKEEPNQTYILFHFFPKKANGGDYN